MGKDLHRKPFDEGTQVKLALYENYIKEWLPVFLAKKDCIYRTINLFDFFAGPGVDKTGQKGSPLLTIDALHRYFPQIIDQSLEVNLFLNEFSKTKIEQLKATIFEQKLDKKPINIFYSSDDFQQAFERYYPKMEAEKTANFLFLDQNGIKQVSGPVFQSILELPVTDFLFFISSSFVHRFSEQPSVKKYIDIPKSKLSTCNYLHIHRKILEYYRQQIPEGKKYSLAPFTIKKGANVYGLIFGSGHMLGIEKFLTTCWKIDPQRGEANFDIDNDQLNETQPCLFQEMNKSKKQNVFEHELKEKILNGELTTNKQVYVYTLSNGFLPTHAREAVKALKKEKKLPKQPFYLSYKSCKWDKEEQPIQLS